VPRNLVVDLIMKLRFLLWMLAILLKRAAKRPGKFREALAGKDATIQFETANHRVSRFYRFFEQKTKSRGKNLTQPDLNIQFVSAKAGFNILWAMATGKDKNAFMKAIQDKQVTVEGDLGLLMWFQSHLKYALR